MQTTSQPKKHSSNMQKKKIVKKDLLFLPHEKDGRISKQVANRSRIKTQPFEKVLFYAGEIAFTKHVAPSPNNNLVTQHVAEQFRVNNSNVNNLPNMQYPVFKPNIKVVRTSISIRELLN